MGGVYTLETLKSVPESPLRYAVLGFPVKHSLSPQLQEAAFHKTGCPGQYIRFEVAPENLPQAVALMKELNFPGWNCTVPHKFGMLALVDEVTETAARMKAVNTVVNRNGRLSGYNTDGNGWVRAMKQDFGIEIKGLRVMILGAGGGAGQALARQSVFEGCKKLVLVNRTVEKVVSLQKELASEGGAVSVAAFEPDVLREKLRDIDLIVNCTSQGLKESEPPVLTADVLHKNLLVYDTIYRPSPTKFLSEAMKAGAKTSNGLSMLLHQGALAFEIWTGHAAPVEVMWEKLKAAATT